MLLCGCILAMLGKLWEDFFFFWQVSINLLWNLNSLCDCSGKLIAAESSIHKNECYLACLCKDLDASFEKVELTILGVYEWET